MPNSTVIVPLYTLIHKVTQGLSYTETTLIWSIGVLHLIRPFSSIQRLFLLFLKFIYYILIYTYIIFIPYKNQHDGILFVQILVS